MNHEVNLPLLILPNLVFFPHTTLPLYIVDKSTSQMIRDVSKNAGYVAIAMAEPMVNAGHVDSAPFYAPRTICGYGSPVILEEGLEGTLKIIIRGVGRARLIKPVSQVPYPVYSAQKIEDTTKEFIYCHDRLERLRDILFNWLDETIVDSKERESFKLGLRTIHQVVDYVSLFLIQDREIRQILLENTSLFERISILNSLLQGDLPLAEDNMVAEALKRYDNLNITAQASGH